MEDYPKTVLELEARFSTEEACRAYLFQLRWPEGFRCPRCGSPQAWALARDLYECAQCSTQTSVTAGTIFQDTHKPLRLWFRAIWYVTSQKNGVSALGLQRVLGLGSYETAWAWLHKLRRAMVRPGRERLSGRVEVDETYIGGEHAGPHGRGALGKAIVVVAAEQDGAGIGRIRLRQVPDFTGASLGGAIQDFVDLGSVVCTDGLRAYNGVGQLGYLHEVLRASAQEGTDPLPPRASGSFVAQTLAAGHPPGVRRAVASGLLPGRVHVPLQPPHLAVAGQAVLPTDAAGRSCRSRACQAPARGHKCEIRGCPQANLSKPDTPVYQL